MAKGTGVQTRPRPIKTGLAKTVKRQEQNEKRQESGRVEGGGAWLGGAVVCQRRFGRRGHGVELSLAVLGVM